MARNNLVYASCTVLYVGSLCEWYNEKHGLSVHKKDVLPSSGKQAVSSFENSLAAKWIAISILAIVLGFTAESAPQFGNPLALLILVAGAIRYGKDIGITFNQTQGSTK